MSDDKKARIDVMSGEYERVGLCEGCGKRVKRTKTFKGTSMEILKAQAVEWGRQPLLHVKCSLPKLTERDLDLIEIALGSAADACGRTAADLGAEYDHALRAIKTMRKYG